MKLLVDMNLSPRWAELLRKEKWEAVHWSTVGAASARDAEVMKFAATNGFVVLTQDLDFGAILAVSGEKTPSVVQLRHDNTGVERLGRFVVSVLRHLTDELERGALVTIELERVRLRTLPLQRTD